MEYKTVYKVTTEGDIEGRTTKTLGYATGDIKDIQAFYDNQKAYSLKMESIVINHISPDLVKDKKELLQEKERIEKRLEYLKRMLG